MTDETLSEIRGRTAFWRDWAKDVYESNIYGIDDRRDLIEEVDRLRRIEKLAGALVRWIDQGGLPANWPNASRLNDLRTELEIK